MRAPDLFAEPEPVPTHLQADANRLVSDLMYRPWGQVSASVYETGRLVAMAPWLTGHAERVAFLLAAQHEDGSWGAPDGYGLVPTLSAVDALLCVLRRGDSGTGTGEPRHAAERGLRALHGWQRDAPWPYLPDMPAIELIVPALVASVNGRLMDSEDAGAPVVWAPLELPPGMSDAGVLAVRRSLTAGAPVPPKLLHALEIAGEAAAGSRTARPTAVGVVGASPAATVAWLGGRGAVGEGDRARGFLEAVVRRHGGPVPVGLPITVFERGWVLSILLRAGIPLDVPPEMVADLHAAIGPLGAAAGPGLPPDADTTSVALYALALLGVYVEPESLNAFETGTHFCTWPSEQGFSVSVNAHVLDAMGRFAAGVPEAGARYAPTIQKIVRVLCAHQQADGSWTDRWHASPYYATLGCALSLDEFGGAAAAPAVARAVRWLLATQRPDGSWGRWQGTAEETAYALQALLLTQAVAARNCGDAVARGVAFLREAPGVDPPLWHDKDLYAPTAIVRAAVLASVHLAQRRISVAARQSQI
jgi:halimadienyl-diphosphate synthase